VRDGLQIHACPGSCRTLTNHHPHFIISRFT
jgi:hypothetical protein